MKHMYMAFFVLLLQAVLLPLSTFAQGHDVIIGHLVRSANPRHPIPDWVNVRVRNENGIINKDPDQVETDEYQPPTLYPNLIHSEGQTTAPATTLKSAATTAAPFDGMGYQSVCPADPSVAVGTKYVMQLINGYSGALYQAYDKTTHTPVFSTTSLNYLDAVSGKGGLGDPIVLYDQAHSVFILTEFQNKKETGSNGLIITIAPESSLSPTSTSTWKSYSFNTTLFPDYPKYSISGGYLYIKTNDFRQQSYNGASIYATDLGVLVSGATTTPAMQHYSLGKANKYYSMCPVTQVGTVATTFSEGGLFAYINPASWSGASYDAIGLVELNPITQSWKDVVTIPVTSYSLPASTVPQVNNAEGLDALANRVMNQPVLRNFSDHQSLVMAFTVKSAAGTDGVRWYELRTTNSASTFAKYQESTYDDVSANTTADPTYRWMPSINMDSKGNVALGYNVSNSKDVYPSLRVVIAVAPTASTGKTYSSEVTLTAGSATSSCSGRYGDYNHLVIDPADDATFWLTGMYNRTADHQWSTSIGAFTLNSSSQTTTLNAVANSIVANEGNLKSIYPNPVHDVLNIQLASSTYKTSIQLLNLSGQVLRQQQTLSGSVKMNVAGLAPSVYLLKITSGRSTSIYKIIKE